MAVGGHHQHAIATEVGDGDTRDRFAVARSAPTAFLSKKAIVLEALAKPEIALEQLRWAATL